MHVNTTPCDSLNVKNVIQTSLVRRNLKSQANYDMGIRYVFFNPRIRILKFYMAPNKKKIMLINSEFSIKKYKTAEKKYRFFL